MEKRIKRPDFCVGEIVEIIGSIDVGPYYGQRAEILASQYVEHKFIVDNEIVNYRGWIYVTTIPPNAIWLEFALAKIPEHEKITWDDCVWKPEKNIM